MCTIFHNLLSEDDLRVMHTQVRLFVGIFMVKMETNKGKCRQYMLPDLKETLGSAPPDTPVVLFCLDNSCFMGLDENGGMNPISKCVEGDDGYHVKRALVVAPERSLRLYW
jgi:hypothetical protein